MHFEISFWELFHGTVYLSFPGVSDGKTSAYSVGDPGSIPGLGSSPREGHSPILKKYSMNTLIIP